jgi:hypothetical protein
MALAFDATARKLGLAAAAATVLLQIAYAGALIGGLMALQSPRRQIADPFFTLMELLILAIAPALIALMVAVHAWAPPQRKAYSLAALLFTTMLAGLTMSVHFMVLTLSRLPAFAAEAWLLSFRWPSVAYALDILAWDVFFPLAVLFAAPVFRGGALAAAIRLLLIASGVIALLGLAGVAGGDMQLRNIGVIGYALVFPIAAALLAMLFQRTPAAPG